VIIISFYNELFNLLFYADSLLVRHFIHKFSFYNQKCNMSKLTEFCVLLDTSLDFVSCIVLVDSVMCGLMAL